MPRDPAGARLRKKRKNREKLARLAEQRYRAAEAAAQKGAGETSGNGPAPQGPADPARPE